MSAVIRSVGLAGRGHEDVDHPPAHLDDLGDLQLEVGRLALGAAVGLVDEHAGVGQRVALAGRAGGEEDGRRRRGLPDADRRHVRRDVLHRVVDAEQGVHVAARRVDVEGDVLARRLRLEVEELGDDQVGAGVVDRRAEEDDAVGEQPGVDVVRPLTAVGRLDDGGDEHGASSMMCNSAGCTSPYRVVQPTSCSLSRCTGPMAGDTRITRTVETDLTPDELWSLVGDGEGWAAWLVDDADIDVEPGATGTVVDDDEARDVRIDRVDPHERVTFTWWPPGGRPGVDGRAGRDPRPPADHRDPLRVGDPLGRAGAGAQLAGARRAV